MHPHHVLILLCCILSASTYTRAASSELALQLAQEGDHRQAAIEWRRIALATGNREDRGRAFWHAGYQYYLEQDQDAAMRMLDAVEDETLAHEDHVNVLRMLASAQAGQTTMAGFYAESLARSPQPPMQRLAHQTSAYLAFLADDVNTAQAQLPAQNTHAHAALAQFRQGSDKSPTLGGLLGILPGLGYAYAGEYANALRSLLLNTIFLYGMTSTAEEDQWGAFAALTFFEITWYSGSIYGGIDAAHRYNRARRQPVLQEMEPFGVLRPGTSMLPAISLQWNF